LLSTGVAIDGRNEAAVPAPVDAHEPLSIDTGGLVDASPVGVDAGGAVDAVPTGAGPFTCTRILGPHQISEWFEAGFETYVNDGNWELVSVLSGFVQSWADPLNAFWKTAPESHCVVTVGGPDRVIFFGFLYQAVDVNTWVTQLTAVVKNLKAMFPNLRRVELATTLRTPDNAPCPDGHPPLASSVSPAQDAANAMVAAATPGFVRVAPKFEVASCADFAGNPPNLGTTAAPAVAAKIGAYYRSSD